MRISWKNNNNLKPQVILDKVNGLKSVDSNGVVSFVAF